LLKLEEYSISDPKEPPNRKGFLHDRSSGHMGYHTKATLSKS